MQIFFSGLRAMMICLPVLALCQPAMAKMVAPLSQSLPQPQGRIVLEVHGAITKSNKMTTGGEEGPEEASAHFDMEMLKALPMVQLETTTAVTDGVHRFSGFLMRDLLALVGAKGSMVNAIALNDYAIEIAIDEFDDFDIIVAYEMNGEKLLPSEKGPLWIIYPRDQHAELQDIRYDYRWVWQLWRLDIR